MKLKLALGGCFEQSYDVAFDGKSIPKEAFRCASIDDNNYAVQDVGKCDPYPAFAEHIKANVAPIIQKGLMKTKYTIHSVDGEQGEIHPHLVIRRNDFALLTQQDFDAISAKLVSIINRYNASNKHEFISSPRLFATLPQDKFVTAEDSQSHRYDLRHPH